MLASFFLAAAQTVLITGASGDIGLEITKNILTTDKKSKVICQYHTNNKPLDELQKKYGEKRVKVIKSDFSSPATIQSFWDSSVKEGSITSVINCAGVEVPDVSDEQREKILHTNFTSPYLISEKAAHHFKENKTPGIIINIGSRAAYRGLPHPYHTYAAAKAALIRISKDIAKDYAKDNVLVYVAAPGPVRGKMFDGLDPEVKKDCFNSIPTGQVVEIKEIVDLVNILINRKLPSGTGSVIELAGASLTAKL